MKFLTLGEKLGGNKPYLHRWCINFGLFSIRLHHWLASDDRRYFHNHPWWYVTFVLWGGYWDVSPIRIRRMHPWSVGVYSRDHWHWVAIDRPCWTLMVTGRRTRTLQFFVNGRAMNANKYFFRFGEHTQTKH